MAELCESVLKGLEEEVGVARLKDQSRSEPYGQFSTSPQIEPCTANKHLKSKMQ